MKVSTEEESTTMSIQSQVDNTFNRSNGNSNAAEGKAENSKNGGGGVNVVKWVFDPNPDISYDAISVMYAVGTFLSLFLYGCETFLAKAAAAAMKFDEVSGMSFLSQTLCSEMRRFIDDFGRFYSKHHCFPSQLRACSPN